ncbi:uncharacterized protein F5Z01DRAFT_215929 [Emericellopsis atlantica]|uniref:Uncharacterized protein n=1 Tax=Emericellopsis atlantica TaxID=2614577 RepID=A0A9P8CTD7_9HYPO|nr:uncharacterized protein F5Z01DRAFT_215929 [Emericellopsis atlantica]KAG9258733.1 hypothetical protein F5Z01DRAFT_215929 [Emericellopsis atlantica]
MAGASEERQATRQAGSLSLPVLAWAPGRQGVPYLNSLMSEGPEENGGMGKEKLQSARDLPYQTETALSIQFWNWARTQLLDSVSPWAGISSSLSNCLRTPSCFFLPTFPPVHQSSRVIREPCWTSSASEVIARRPTHLHHRHLHDPSLSLPYPTTVSSRHHSFHRGKSSSSARVQRATYITTTPPLDWLHPTGLSLGCAGPCGPLVHTHCCSAIA